MTKSPCSISARSPQLGHAVEKMLQAALFIVICGCVMTYNHDCQTCIGVFGVFNCQSSHFSKCAVIHGSESTIREIRLFNCDAWIIPTGWSPDSHVTIRDSNGKPCEGKYFQPPHPLSVFREILAKTDR